jgi:hypothetical protein
MRPGQASNNTGYTVGDRWRYQKVDKFKQEVVDNWSRQVMGFGELDVIRLNNGAVRWAADGSIKGTDGPNGSFTNFAPSYKWIPSVLKADYTEPFKHKIDWRHADGLNGTEDREGTLKVVGQVKVKVPAGEFDTWRLEVTGWINGINNSSHAAYTGSFKETFWYAPSLHNFVASEYERRNQQGHIQTNDRHELTSYSVHDTDRLAKR